MPNHVKNILSIAGPKQSVQAFYDFNKGENGPLDFSKAAPEKYDDKAPEKYGWGWDWQVNEWGTKWNAYEICQDEINHNAETDKSTLVYEFSTAWSDPDKWYAKAFVKFPDLTAVITCVDEGLNFFGMAHIANGEYIVDFRYNYHTIPAFLLEQKNVVFDFKGNKEYFAKLVKDYNLKEYGIDARILGSLNKTFEY